MEDEEEYEQESLVIRNYDQYTAAARGSNDFDKYTLPVRTINLIEGMTSASSYDQYSTSKKKGDRKPPIDSKVNSIKANMYEQTDAYRKYIHKIQKSRSNLKIDTGKLLE